MGAWDIGFFDGDTGEDWLDTISDPDTDDEEIDEDLADAVLAVLQGDADLIEAPDCEDALVAAELLAAAAGYPRSDLPRRAATWAKGAGTPDGALLQGALAAVRIATGERSELVALWLEDPTGGERRAWNEQVAGLIERLERAIAAPVISERRPRRRRPERREPGPGDLVELRTRHGNFAYVQVVRRDEDGFHELVRVFGGAFRKRPADLAALAAEPEAFIAWTQEELRTVVGTFPVPHVEKGRKRPFVYDVVDQAVGWVAGVGVENVRD